MDNSKTISLSSLPQNIQDAIERCARGCYQRSLLAGEARWSGADLRGRARDWSASYARSRDALLSRVDKVLRAYGYETTFTGGTAKAGPLELVAKELRLDAAAA